jgi:signal peptidase I
MSQQRPIGVFCFVALCIAAVRFYTLTGFVTPVVISGDSMAETLYGERLQIDCERCEYCYAVTATAHSALSCPRCRQRNVIEQGRGVAADNVLIDTAAYWFTAPKRFDCIAFHEPGSSRLAVKRIVALPGEAWRFYRGDLWINDQLVRKTPAQFLETAVKLYDSQPLNSIDQARWQTEQRSGEWTRKKNYCWEWQGRAGESSANERLNLQHTAVHAAAKNKVMPWNDDDPFNIGSPRQLQDMTDIALAGQITLSPRTQIAFHIHNGYREYVLTYKPPELKKTTSYKFMAGHWDRQLWLTLDSSVIEKRELSVEESHPQPSITALGISGAGEGTILLDHVQVWRDLNYTHPAGTSNTWQPAVELKENEYGVLGDNLPVSIDTRHWEKALLRSQIMGKVMLWKRHFSL